ncbi:tRNA (N(6)-L-threonylcarbamoyladenosine(37)-C(2))-methylthiotransferase [Methanogenium sp. MK-MG]|uniref:tRNA (N(6)-L-threonylcarbamoyladenosine(37)-C(2))- methylthiotransferase n=1 Tax=Methanogenium sp. MK-MG TaxID=2599926 RepID=UPI0013E9D16F|nr:tRNA (N(6)-L-threonylcarbamoyladenosine(37)-C(2))-methylthiotransferase [Methanogenium sp. MK-MG]KAF1076178.1 tRNA-2-methylthio-N(6)-dimethylallyladenosine synthase [Methanogenium sp. MK-MG]
MDTLRNKTIHAESYGCTFNHADTEKIIALAERQGCLQVPAEEAECIIINTCTVVGATERTMLRRIRAYAGKEIVVTGCMPVVQRDLLLETDPNLHIILPETLYTRCPEVGAMTDSHTGVVQTGTGCLGSCSYCITRLARGPLKSFSAEAIVAEVERLAALGAYEIQLTGQDVSAWGMDIGQDLAYLLKQIAGAEGDFCLRVGMMNPATAGRIIDSLAPAFAHEKIFGFVHLPVQSGSDAVLASMNRGYTAETFEEIVAAFRAEIPDVRVSTDIIAGFPAEGCREFDETLEMLGRVRPTKVNITRFSVREGTPAALYHDHPDRVKKERSRALTHLTERIYDEENLRWIGRRLPVLVTEQKKNGSVIARDATYQNIVIKEEVPLGTRLWVTVTGHHRHYLLAEPV